MRSYLSMLILSALLFLVSGCSTLPFKGTELVPVTATTSSALVDHLWISGSGRLLIRQTALFELKGMRTFIDGVMRLDLDRKNARLVAMNEMGVKLFDLAIEAKSSEAIFVIPELTRYPGFTEAVATSVRRIFLAPQPSPDDRLTLARESYLLTGTRDGLPLTFLFGGRNEQLLEKRCISDIEQWRVSYYEYQQKDNLPLFPRGIVLEDELAGYRLTLWIESVEKTDE